METTKSPKKSSFQIVDEMSKKNMEVAASTELIEARVVRKGVRITFGLDSTWGSRIMKSMGLQDGKYVAICLVINREQFDQLDK